jgi:hypothetical protein
MVHASLIMKVEIKGEQPTVNAEQIAPLFDLDVIGFQVLMQSGNISTGVERGTGKDMGKLRLTFKSPDWRVRLTCAGDGTVLTTTRVRLPKGGR